MIALLTGRIVEINSRVVTIDVGGVGYEVICSLGCIGRLNLGSEATIVIHTDVHEDSIRLYGFSDQLEKRVFGMLIRVNGVGARTASDIISQIEKRELLRIIGEGDLTRLQKIKGIGRKTAERIVVELRDHVAEYVVDNSASGLTVERVSEPAQDAIDALAALGFSRKDAQRAVDQVKGSGKAGNNGGLSSGEIVKEALRFV